MAQARYTSLADFFGTGLRGGTGTDRTYSDASGQVYENPNYGLDNNALFSKALNGQAANDYWNNYVNSDAYKYAYGDPSKNPFAPRLTADGQVQTMEDNPSNWFVDSLKVPATFAALIGTAGAASGALGGGAAAGAGGAEAGGSFIGSGLVDGLGAAGYGGAELGAGAGFGSGLVDGLGAAADGYGGAGAGLGGVGGSGLTDAEMNALINEAGSNITTGAAGGGVGTGAGGSASLLNQLQSFFTGGGTGGSLNTPPGGSSLYKLLTGQASAGDYVDAAGRAIPGILSYFGNQNIAKKQDALAQQYAGYGAPYRSLLEQYTNDPNAYFNSPAAQAMFDQVSRKFSVGGNPAGDPFKQAQIMGALAGQYGNERNLLGQLGGLSAAGSAAPQLAGQSLQTQGQAFSNLGSALGNVTNPQTLNTLESVVASLKQLTQLKGVLA